MCGYCHPPSRTGGLRHEQPLCVVGPSCGSCSPKADKLAPWAVPQEAAGRHHRDYLPPPSPFPPPDPGSLRSPPGPCWRTTPLPGNTRGSGPARAACTLGSAREAAVMIRPEAMRVSNGKAPEGDRSAPASPYGVAGKWGGRYSLPWEKGEAAESPNSVMELLGRCKLKVKFTDRFRDSGLVHANASESRAAGLMYISGTPGCPTPV